MAILLLTACRRDPELPAAAESVCKASALDAVLEAVEGADPSFRTQLTARGLTEACPRIPEPLILMLQGFESVDPSTTAQMVAAGVADNVALWMRACDGGVATFAEMVALAPDAKSAFLVKHCFAGAESPFATSAELEAAGSTELTVALLVHQALIDGHVDARRARTMARYLLGP